MVNKFQSFKLVHSSIELIFEFKIVDGKSDMLTHDISKYIKEYKDRNDKTLMR